MVVQAEQDRVRHLLTQAIPLLCKNGLSFSSEFCIEALIGITLDKNDVFLVSIKETVKLEGDNEIADNSLDISVSKLERHADDSTKSSARRKQYRKRRRSKSSSKDTDSENEVEDSQEQTAIKRDRTERAALFERLNNTSNETSSMTGDDTNDRTVEQDDSLDAIIIKEEPIESEYSVRFGDVSLAAGMNVSGYVPGTGEYTPQTGDNIHNYAPSDTLHEESLPGYARNDTLLEDSLPGTSHQQTDSEAAGRKYGLGPTGMKIKDLLLPVADAVNASDFVGETADGLYRCCICQRLSRNKSNARKHVRVVHLKIRSALCAHCGRGFGQTSNRKAHEANCALKQCSLKQQFNQYKQEFK